MVFRILNFIGFFRFHSPRGLTLAAGVMCFIFSGCAVTVRKPGASFIPAVPSAVTYAFTSTPSNRLFPISSANPPLIQSDTSAVQTFTWATNANAITNTGPVTWTCKYSSVGLDATALNYALDADCGSLPSLQKSSSDVWYLGSASFSSGLLTWNPTNKQIGTFQFTVTATLTPATGSATTLTSTWNATVRENITYSTSGDLSTAKNLILGYHAAYSDGVSGISTTLPVIPRNSTNGNNTNTWFYDFGSAGNNADLSGWSAGTPWLGSGVYTSPYNLYFSSQSINVSSALTSATKIMYSTWVYPTLPPMSSVLASNGGGSGNGFVLRASNRNSIQYVFEVGTSPNSADYNNQLVADGASAIWKLDEIAGVTAADSAGVGFCSGIACDGTFSGNYTLGGSGALEFNSAKSVAFDGTNAGMSVPDDPNLDITGVGPFTLEGWIKPNANDGTWRTMFGKFGYDGANYQGFHCVYVGAIGLGVVCERYRDGVRDYVDFLRPVPTSVWSHIVFTFDGTTLKGYVNGVLAGTGAQSVSLSDNPYPFWIGRDNDGRYFSGSIANVSFYKVALTASQVLTHYQAGAGCRTQNPVSLTSWNQLTAIWDGTTQKLYRNGLEECNLAPRGGGTFVGGNTSVYLGSDTAGANKWVGRVSDIELYGTSGASPGVAADASKNYLASSNRFRQNPVENIVTSNLVAYWDAAYAKNGLTAPANGCSYGEMNWTELTGTIMNTPLAGMGSTACNATHGWVGDGSTTNPYAVALDGTNDFIPIYDASTFPASNFTVCAWVNIGSALPATTRYFYGQGSSAGVNHVDLGCTNAGGLYTTNGFASQTKVGVFAANTWTHVCYAHGGEVYKNGTDVGGAMSLTTVSVDAKIGSQRSGSSKWPGSIANVMVYNSILTQAQVRQNCHAQKGRFSGVSCAGP